MNWASQFNLNTLQVFSQILGWTYFLAWTVSFYPQVILNARRKTVEGLSIDFATLNTIGFFCYSVYALNFRFNPAVREEYRNRHDGHDNGVQLNDVAFAVHAFFISAFTLAQTFYYPRAANQRISTYNRVVISAAFVLLIGNLLALGWGSTKLIDLLYNLSYFKLYISLAKYIPQMFINFRRKSTSGWSIGNILLDFTGGSLSFIQLFLDSASAKDWSSITGNPVKLGLAVQSMTFDVIFIVQHYILYQDRSDPALIMLDGQKTVQVRLDGDVERGVTETSRLL